MRGTKRVAEDRARGEDMVGEAARVGVLFADAPPGLVHQEPVEDVGGFVDGGRDGLRANGENRSETCEIRWRVMGSLHPGRQAPQHGAGSRDSVARGTSKGSGQGGTGTICAARWRGRARTGCRARRRGSP